MKNVKDLHKIIQWNEDNGIKVLSYVIRNISLGIRVLQDWTKFPNIRFIHAMLYCGQLATRSMDTD